METPQPISYGTDRRSLSVSGIHLEAQTKMPNVFFPEDTCELEFAMSIRSEFRQAKSLNVRVRTELVGMRFQNLEEYLEEIKSEGNKPYFERLTVPYPARTPFLRVRSFSPTAYSSGSILWNRQEVVSVDPGVKVVNVSTDVFINDEPSFSTTRVYRLESRLCPMFKYQPNESSTFNLGNL